MPRSDLFVPLDGGEDGIESVEHILSEDAIHALCERIRSKDPERWMCAEAQDVLAACGERMREIRRLLREHAERIPVPQGFFVGNAERIDAYAESCRLLLRLEPAVTALRVALVVLGDFEHAWIEAERRQASFRRELLCALPVLQEPMLTRIKETLAKQDRQLACGRAWVARLGDFRRDTSVWVCDTYPQGCERLQSLSDMGHEGASCDPLAVRQLCTELEDTIAARLRVLEQTMEA